MGDRGQGTKDYNPIIQASKKKYTKARRPPKWERTKIRIKSMNLVTKVMPFHEHKIHQEIKSHRSWLHK